MASRRLGYREEPARTSANEERNGRNNGQRFRGGNRGWRGGNNRPRTRTESWPAVRNGAGYSVFVNDRPETTYGRRGGHCFVDGQTYPYTTGNRNIGQGQSLPFSPVRTDLAPTAASSRGFVAFSCSAPSVPAPILQPNVYFEMENHRRAVPPIQLQSNYALHGVCSPSVRIPLQHHHRYPDIAGGFDPMQVVDKRLQGLKLENEQGDACSSTKTVQTMEDSNETLVQILAKRELGYVNKDKMKRRTAEIRIREGAKTESGTATTVKKILADYPGESLQQCQFMEATPNGKYIFGSWALQQRDWSRIMCAEVGTKRGAVEEGRYGVTLTPSDNYIYVMDKNVVDLCQAKVDVAVTCVLYVTVQPEEPRGSRIFLQPVPELSDSNDQALFTTPIYNAHWALNQGALSCAWDFTKMRLSIGLERYGMILDVVSETDFKLFSCHKNVLSQKFSKDGSLLFMGVRDSSILCCDLRRQYHHAVYALPQTSVCWLRLLSDSNYLVAADLSGQIKLWDLRAQQVLCSFDGHTSSRTKLPVVIDEQDSLVFAVSDNGTTSGWSLKTGRLLRQIPSPYPVTDRQSLPRVCYSGCWGGVAGNAALVLGVGDEAHFYEFQL